MQSWKVRREYVEAKDGTTTAEMYFHPRASSLWFDVEGFQGDGFHYYDEVNLDFEVPLDALCALLEMHGYMLVKKENIEP